MHFPRLVRRLATALVLLAPFGPACADTALFIGNSYTFGAGDPEVRKLGVPGLVAAIAAAKGRHLEPDAVTEGGKDLGYHLEQPATTTALSAKARDWLVLQDHSLQFSKTDGIASHIEHAEALYHRFRENSPAGRVVLYQTWPRSPRNAIHHGAADGPATMFAGIEKLYAASDAKLESLDPGEQVRVAPVGRAFLLCLSRHPEINLYSEDEHHASASGSYLSALVLYATLFADDPTGATRVFPGLEIEAERAAALQEIAAEVTAETREAARTTSSQSGSGAASPSPAMTASVSPAASVSTAAPTSTTDAASAPEAAKNLSTAQVADAVAELARIVGQDGVSGVVVVQNGRELWAGDRVEEVRPVWSCTKSFLSTCLGLLWDDGKLTPDDLAARYLPELERDYPTVTLRQLATFTSGVRVEPGSLEAGAPCFAPGTAIHYSAESDLLARILTRVAGEPLADFFRRRIAEPIAMNPAGWTWKTAGERDGITVNGGSGFPDSGMHMNARALARFGALFANDGVWNGRRLISRRYLDFATRPLVPANLPPHDPKDWYHVLPGAYGLNWWCDGIRADGTRLWPHAPATAFAAQGNKNNICIIIPDWRLVLVRTGADEIIDVAKYDQALEILAKNSAKRPHFK